MAYDGNRLFLVDQGVQGALRRWVYFSADSLATVLGSAYFSDGTARGMTLGDIVECFVGTINVAITTIPSTAAAGDASVLSALTAFARLQVTTAGATTCTVSTLPTQLAPTTGSLLSFYGVTAIGQRASSAHASVTTTAISSVTTAGITSSTAWGWSSSTVPIALVAAVNFLVTQEGLDRTLLNQIQVDLVAYGLLG